MPGGVRAGPQSSMTFDAKAVCYPVDSAGLGSCLGNYYQDFSDAVRLVTCGVHGPMDPDGRPMCAGSGGCHYDAIIVAQYGLGLLKVASSGETAAAAQMAVQADWLVSAQHRTGERAGFWLQRFVNAKYPALGNPWVSALAQGNCISLLLRAWEMHGKDEYLDAARAGFTAMLVPLAAGGVLSEREGDVWLEEYPLEPPGHVLNGAIYALWGVLDYARVTGDPRAWGIWRRGAETIARRAEEFDTGFWTRYELATPELVSLHYHKNIHIPQLEVMQILTGSPVFGVLAHRWRRYLSSPTSAIRRRIEGRIRWRRSAATRRAPAYTNPEDNS